MFNAKIANFKILPYDIKMITHPITELHTPGSLPDGPKLFGGLTTRTKIAIVVGVLAVTGAVIGLIFAFKSKKSPIKRPSTEVARPGYSPPPGVVVGRGGVLVHQVKCKDSVEHGATVDAKTGVIDATFLDKPTNKCRIACDVTGTGDHAAKCTDICKNSGRHAPVAGDSQLQPLYDRFIVDDGNARCVKNLECDKQLATSVTCGDNIYCSTNEASLDKLKVPMVDDKSTWTCTPPDAQKTWEDACNKNLGGTWLADRKYCWTDGASGCLTAAVADSDNATVNMDVHIGSSALQNNIAPGDDLSWSIVLSSAGGSKQYTYVSPLISPSLSTTCPDTCSPCISVGVRFSVLSEGHSPDLPADFEMSIQTTLKSNPNVIVAKSITPTSIHIKPDQGLFAGPIIDQNAAKRVMKNIALFEGLAKGTDLTLRSDKNKKQMMDHGGVPYEETPGKDALLIPCSLLFCTSASSIHRKFIVIAWKSIPPDTVKKQACGGAQGITPDVWYWVGRLDNKVDPPEVKQMSLQKREGDKGDTPMYLLDTNAEVGLNLTYQIAAILVPKGETPPSLLDGLGRISCRSFITTVNVSVSEYSNKSCKQFLPQQVVGEIITDKIPVPNYAWAQNGRCVWGRDTPNAHAYQSYACLYDDRSRDSTPKPPDRSSFQLYNENARTCDTVIAYQEGGKPPRYLSTICTDDLASHCTTGANSEQITYTCSNDLGFSKSAIRIDPDAFATSVTGASAIASRHDVSTAGFDTRDAREKTYSNIVRKACPPLESTSCVDAKGSLTDNCSSSWATSHDSCTEGDAMCTNIVTSAGVRNCTDDNQCLSNSVAAWDCTKGGQKWTCTQNRDKCFAYSTDKDGHIEKQPNLTCCSGNGYAIRLKDGSLRCWGAMDKDGGATGDDSCMSNAKFSYTSTVDVWPQCSVQEVIKKEIVKPVCKGVSGCEKYSDGCSECTDCGSLNLAVSKRKCCPTIPNCMSYTDDCSCADCKKTVDNCAKYDSSNCTCSTCSDTTVFSANRKKCCSKDKFGTRPPSWKGPSSGWCAEYDGNCECTQCACTECHPSGVASQANPPLSKTLNKCCTSVDYCTSYDPDTCRCTACLAGQIDLGIAPIGGTGPNMGVLRLEDRAAWMKEGAQVCAWHKT